MNTNIFRQGIQGDKLPIDYQCDGSMAVHTPFVMAKQTFDQPHSPGTQIHPGVEIGVLVAGKCCQYVDGVYYTLEPGDCFFSHAMVPHNIFFEGGSTWIYVHVSDTAIVSIPPQNLSFKILQTFYVPLTNCTPVLVDQNKLGELLECAVEHFNGNQKFSKVFSWSFVVAALAEIATLVAPFQTSGNRADDRNVQKILQAVNFIHHQYNRSFKWEDLAHDCCMSYPHFRAMFKNIMHCAPHEYLGRVRINSAINELVSTNSKIESIAYNCGFEAVNSFNYLFKKCTGYSPQQFRKS